MKVWYAAQKWFIDSYEGGQGVPYLLYLADQPGEGIITLSFFIGENVTFGGRTIFTEGNGLNPTVQIQINLPPDHAQDPNDLFVEAVILHELGHALGLGHSQNQLDAMYYAIDNFPKSYGLPSTLDLATLYQLSQTQDPSTLGSSFCLPNNIGYGLPPWLQQTQSGLTLQIPFSSPAETYTGSYFCTSSVILGNATYVTLRFSNTGNYPIRILSAFAHPDFGPAVNTTEQLPVTAFPGETNLTFSILVPTTTNVGQHNVTSQIGLVGMGIDGWPSNVQYAYASCQITVQPPPVYNGLNQEPRSPKSHSQSPPSPINQTQ
jgi:hypothetical protein